MLRLRKAQAGDLYREYSGDKGYLDGPSAKTDFLKRNGAAFYGAVNPKLMPYYLLLIGSPGENPDTLSSIKLTCNTRWGG